MHIFSGLYKNQKIIAPKGQKTRPTTGMMRQALFNICQTFIEGADFLDLFAGSGAMGLEALSRGANSVTFVDNSRESINCMQANLKRLQAEKKAKVLYGDVFTMLEKLEKEGKRYSIIYADPPYDTTTETEEGTSTLSKRILRTLDLSSLLLPQGFLFVEDSAATLLEEVSLNHLKLVSRRRMGRTGLHQFEKIL